MSVLRILLVANKTWECEPLVSVLLSRDARPSQLSSFSRGYDPSEVAAKAPAPALMKGNLPVRPRLSFAANSEAAVEVWCIEDWMRVKSHSSSSHEKLNWALPQIQKHAFGGQAPDLVIAFGTAGIPIADSLNGCVTIGSRVYIHDPWAGAPASELAEQEAKYGPMIRNLGPHADKELLSPRLKDSLFGKDLSAELRISAESRFLRPPINAAELPRVLASHGFASLGTINICNYDDYVWADEATLKQFEKNVRQREIGSMETTHGLIRLTWDSTPFLFVSGLTDRVPLFGVEVTPRKYAQNFVAAHNAGVAAAFLIADLGRIHSSEALFSDLPPATA